MNKEKPLRLGILGTARILRRIVAVMQAVPGIEVAAIASRDAKRASWYATQHGIGKSYGEYRQLIESPEIDAVYLPLPPSLHSEWAIAAATAGKHVLCEKPLAINLESAITIDEACRTASVKWLDATAWLHHERTHLMKSIVNDQLGGVQHVTAAVSFFEPFQTNEHRLDADLGGGCLLDLGWYSAGVCYWAVDSLPEVLAATGSKKQGVWYRVTALVRWENGTTGTIHCGFDIASRKWMEVAGKERSLVCDDFTRPWADRPARCCVHDRAGTVEKIECSGNQEANMFVAFRDGVRGDVDLSSFNRQAMGTQRFIGSIERKLIETSSCE